MHLSLPAAIRLIQNSPQEYPALPKDRMKNIKSRSRVGIPTSAEENRFLSPLILGVPSRLKLKGRTFVTDSVGVCISDTILHQLLESRQSKSAVFPV